MSFLNLFGFKDTPLIHSADGHAKIYAQSPKNFAPQFEIVACFSHFKNKYLLLHRSPHIKNQPNVWGVPGGSLEAGEFPLQAILREFLEETGVSLDPKKVVFFRTVSIISRTSTGLRNDFIFHMFTYEFLERPVVQLNPQEHQAAAWKSIEEAALLPLILGETECFELLRLSSMKGEVK